MKIKTLEELEDKLDQDLAWRKKEILSLKLLIDKNDQDRNILLRAGIALLCAHFEGFIKKASNLYVIYIGYQKVQCSNIINSLLAIKFKKDFENCGKTDKHSIHAEMLNKLDQIKNETFFLKYKEDSPIISTQSNPSSEVLDEILNTLGISSTIFETKKQYIDFSLLYKRHKVVHGYRFEIEYDDFDLVSDIVMKLIDEYKNIIIKSAEEKIFLKNKPEGEYANCS